MWGGPIGAPCHLLPVACARLWMAPDSPKTAISIDINLCLQAEKLKNEKKFPLVFNVLSPPFNQTRI
jgi:hypothetical protein